MATKQDFLSSKIAIEVHNEDDCRELLDFINSYNIDIGELNEGHCKDYPYFFLESLFHLNATYDTNLIRILDMVIVPFDEVFKD